MVPYRPIGEVPLSEFHATWRLGKFNFHLVRGDIFQVPARAIVNSEQTDFVLAQNRSTISGQICQRWGDQVRVELDKQTAGAVLPPGTVLTTSGGDYDAIFHAGFHHPAVFLDV